MLTWKFAKIFRYQNVFEAMIALWHPATNVLNKSYFPFPIFSCLLLLSNPDSSLDLWVVHHEHIFWRSVAPVSFSHKGEKLGTWNGFAEDASPCVGSVAIKNTPEVCSACYWYCTVTAPKLHLVLCAEHKFSSAHEKCYIFFCLVLILRLSIRHESWAWNHNFLLGGT